MTARAERFIAATAGRSKTRAINSRSRPINFDRVNRAAMAMLPSLLARWLPGGRVAGAEYVALNPRRPDCHLGSFKVNRRNGRWADFAVQGARGRDVVSLLAYLAGIRQVDAARRLADMLGVGLGGPDGS